MGAKLRCPRCEIAQDICAYHTFGRVEKFAHELVPVHKCKRCGHYFAPAEPTEHPDADR